MKKTVWEEREKAFEDKYFRDLEQEQLRKLREKNDSHRGNHEGGDAQSQVGKDQRA
jgi:hypothetical protein